MNKKLFDSVAFGGELRKAIESSEIGVREAGRQIGCSHATISRICRGHPPDVEHYLKIQHWLVERPKRFVSIPVEVVDFLTGSAPLNGRWFGEADDENERKRPYWWRAYLRPDKLVYDKAKRTIVKAPTPQHIQNRGSAR